MFDHSEYLTYVNVDCYIIYKGAILLTKAKEKKSGFWRELFRKRVHVKVISGGHFLAETPEGKGLLRSVEIAKGDVSGEVITISTFGRKTFTFNRISWERNSERSGGKAAVGAIGGALVAGPLGAIAGAAVGGRKKDDSSAFVYLTGEDGEEIEIHIECTKEQYAEIDRLPW